MALITHLLKESSQVTSHTWCTTELEWEQLTYRWDIPCFIKIPSTKPNKVIQSPLFTILNSDMPSTWRLRLYPFGNGKEGTDERLSIFIRLVSSKRGKEIACVRFSIIQSDGNSCNTYDVHSVFSPSSDPLGVLNWIARSSLTVKLNQLLPGGTLTIKVELYVLSNTEHRSGILECPSSPSLVYSFDPSCSPDCSITLDSWGPITFHRAIMHATSPALLDHLTLLSLVDQKKRGNKKVNSTLLSTMTSLTGQVLRDLIDYVYHNNLPDLPAQLERVEHLLKVAHEYSIIPLKCSLEKALIGHLDTLEQSRLLLLARETKSTNLESEVTQYVGQHREVMRGKRWLEDITDQPDLVPEQVRKMFRTSVSSRVCITSKHLSSLCIMHQWCIVHFDRYSGEVIESLCFGDAEGRTQWRLRLFPNGINKDTSGYIGIELVCLKSCSVAKLCGFIMIGEKRMFLSSDTMKIDRWLERKSFFESNPSLKENMTIKLGFTFSVSIEENEPGSTWLSPKIDFFSSFKHLYSRGRWSDVTIVVGDYKFLLHQVILAAVSPVFKAMFSHDMIEKIERTVKIDDLDESTFNSIVQYIYTSSEPFFHDLAYAEKILVAADKYQIEPLKSITEEALLELISIKDVAHIVQMAEKCNATNLFNQSVGFIKSNLFAVMMTTSWAQLSRTNPSLREQLVK